MDYFEKFYSKYQAASESGKEFPCCIARLLFGRGSNAPDERMVYVTNQECWDQELQKEEYEEGSHKLDTPIECYNLFLQKYENMDAELFNNRENIYSAYVKCQEAGKFVRSYKNLEKAKEAVSVRNEWIGWGNVNKKNVYMIDYEYLKEQMEGDSQIFIF